MKKKILVLVVALFIAGAAQSQQTTKPAKEGKMPAKEMTAEERVNHEVKKRTKQLGLTEGQQKQWHESALIFEQDKDKLKQQKQGTSTKEEKKALREQLNTSRSNFDAAVLVILDPAQELKWADIQKKEQERRDKRRDEKKAGNPNQVVPKKP